MSCDPGQVDYSISIKRLNARIGFGVATRGDGRMTLGGEEGRLVPWQSFSQSRVGHDRTHIIGARRFTSFYLRWRLRALAISCCSKMCIRQSATHDIPHRSRSPNRSAHATAWQSV
jgi:hypothetical protein